MKHKKYKLDSSSPVKKMGSAKETKKIKEYYLSFFEEEKETPKTLQDKMLKVLIADGWCDSTGVQEYWSLKKHDMIEYFDIAFPKYKRSILNARLNELMKVAVIEKSVKYKTKPYLIKGRCWDSRVKQIESTLEEKTVEELCTEVIMGANPAMKARFITDNGTQGRVDK